MAEHNILYFRNLWQKNMLDLEQFCTEWEKVCDSNTIPDDVLGEIRTAIGLARLLMNQKLKQFKGLIDDSEFNTGEKEITCSDLEGFWDMVYYEVEKIQKTFKKLDECKNSDWKFIEEISETKKKIPVKRDNSAINRKKEISKAQALAARQRIAELKKKMALQQRKDKDLNEIDILLPVKKDIVANTPHKDDLNKVALNDKATIMESTEKKKSNHKLMGKENISTTINDLFENSSDLNSAIKQKSAQKKKSTTSNKENVSLEKDSSDVKHTPVKQARMNAANNHGSERKQKKSDYLKLQCVTRSAAKKALQKQNFLQL